MPNIASEPVEWETPLIMDDESCETEVTRPAAVVDLPVAVRIAANGTVLESVDEDLAGAVAYTGRLADLIGELLGVDGFRAIEFASQDERIVIYVEEAGGLVAGRLSADADVSVLRERLSL